MKLEVRRVFMNLKARQATLGIYCLSAMVLIGASVLAAQSQARGETNVQPQNLIRLESRISQLEQRLYSFEVNVRSLEQQVRLSTNAPDPTRAAPTSEMSALRTEVEGLRQNLQEIACGLLRIDERTLSATAREARRKTTTDAGDPCRLESGNPLRLSVRP
jgi:hypothetical protein